MRKIINSVKKFLASPKTRAVAVMLLVGGTAAFAQSAAGDYTAGTSALTTVAEEIAKYVPIVVKLCYAIAGVVAIIGAISVYIAMNNGKKGQMDGKRRQRHPLPRLPTLQGAAAAP